MTSLPSPAAHPARPARPHRDADPGTGLRYRAGVASRTVAAIGGGYLLASLGTEALARALPLAPVDNVITATLAGLVLYPCAVMWSFAAASAVRAWLGLGAACALTMLVLLALRALGGAA